MNGSLLLDDDKTSKARSLAVWILAAKLPNSDLNFAVLFWGGFFLFFLPTEEGPTKIRQRMPQQNHPEHCLEKSPSNLCRNLVLIKHTIGNSRITYHHFILWELFLVIISSWFTSKIQAELFLVICRKLHLFASPPTTYVIITSENSGGINFREDFMRVTSKYSRGINIVIQAFRMVVKDLDISLSATSRAPNVFQEIRACLLPIPSSPPL